jgi:hypothetical protein
MEDITCVKVNESRSEFADKEEKYGIFSEIGGSCPDDILGIRRPRKVAKTAKRQ